MFPESNVYVLVFQSKFPLITKLNFALFSINHDISFKEVVLILNVVWVANYDISIIINYQLFLYHCEICLI